MKTRGEEIASRQAASGRRCRPVAVRAVSQVSCLLVDNTRSMTMPRTTAAPESADSDPRTRCRPCRGRQALPAPGRSSRPSSIGSSPSRPRCRRRSDPVDNPRPDLIPFQTRTVRPLQLHPRIPTDPCFPGPELRLSARPNDLSRKIRDISLLIVANLGRHDYALFACAPSAFLYADGKWPSRTSRFRPSPGQLEPAPLPAQLTVTPPKWRARAANPRRTTAARWTS